MEAKRLLLADDERELSQALVAILRHAGYEVDASPDGEDALYKLNVNGYDLVILDIMMPKVDGLTVLRPLREEGHEVPVLLLTARAEGGALAPLVWRPCCGRGELASDLRWRLRLPDGHRTQDHASSCGARRWPHDGRADPS